jgi:hypothetical protein
MHVPMNVKKKYRLYFLDIATHVVVDVAAVVAAVVVDFFNNIITKQLVCLGLIPNNIFAFFCRRSHDSAFYSS